MNVGFYHLNRSGYFGLAIALAAVCLLSPGAVLAQEAGALTPERLRCEYRVEPLGVDVTEPRLSWIVTSEARGQVQSAYRVLVASDAATLARDEGDLWDSGKVASDETTAVVYAGKPLTSHQPCHWKVMVWDRDGRPSAWSEPAAWSMGLLRPEDWAASQWIGFDEPRATDDSQIEAQFESASWIWHAADAGAEKPKANRLFVANLDLPADVAFEKAELLLAADDQARFTINGTLVGSITTAEGGWKAPRQVDVSHNLKPGANTIRAEVENSSPGPAGLLARLVVTLKGGRTVELVTDGSWKSTDQPGANWHNRPLDTAGWPTAAVVAAYGAEPWGRLQLTTLILPPPSHLRTSFAVEKPVQRATLYATALGLVDVHLNGARVYDDFFNPGWTDYTKRVLYRAYDVTDRLQQGENALGAILADGWYSGYVGFGSRRDHYGTKPRARVLLHVEYADGTTADVGTGPDWKAATGPIREADFLMGEVFDARATLDGWDAPGFDDAAWKPVDVGAEMDPVLQWHPGQPVEAIEEFRARSITEPSPGAYVLDLGRNFAGVPRLTINGKPGQKITLRFAERLNPDGTIYTTNLRSARATDTYICKGGGPETWQPRFTFHGFQYVEITGIDAPPTAETVVGIALTSTTPVVGSFACSDEMLNQLHGNIIWTQFANFIDIPTDCPQRDERLGWTGDAQVYVRTASLNCDVQAFFTKWLQDLLDGQRADGQFPMVAPVKVAGDDGGPAWADAGTIVPWTLYQVYGDRRLLARQYPSMVRFIEFCQGRSQDGVLPPEKYHAFGDWLSINADTPKDVIYTAYYAYSTLLTSKAAEVLGKSEDAQRFRQLYEDIKAAFNRAYVADDGRITGDTQAVYVLALAVDLVDGERREQAARHLVANIEARDWHLSTGFIGTKDLMLVLSKIGRPDVAYRLLHNETFPSWGFSIKHGATSIWERWDGWTPEKGFQDPGMNSFAHYSFGAVYQWMVENIGGIHAADVAYKQIAIAPVPDSKLTSARTTYDSIRGLIATDWQRRPDGGLDLAVTIPANTTATVTLPAARAEGLTESGRPLAQAEGVRLVSTEDGSVILAVGSGTYRFSAPAR